MMKTDGGRNTAAVQERLKDSGGGKQFPGVVMVKYCANAG
jgi:hypothetical protein